jgi:hypothetical protein
MNALTPETIKDLEIVVYKAVSDLNPTLLDDDLSDVRNDTDKWQEAVDHLKNELDNL